MKTDVHQRLFWVVILVAVSTLLLGGVNFSPSRLEKTKPMLRWEKVEGAVSYEIELYAEFPGVAPFFSTSRISVNGYSVDLSTIFSGEYFFWWVRALDIDKKPIGAFSEIKKASVDREHETPLKPVPTSFFNQRSAYILLYPVYAWIPIAGAEKYEVEILDERPENPNGIAPSVHRIDSAVAVGFDWYDEKPRQSDRPFWWRVRGLAKNGDAVGVYSDAGQFSVNPNMKAAVAAFGDSITHGGGNVSSSPADWEYSYLTYLDFDVINLGRSSDTSQTMAERFERDVVPFQPPILLIMGGTNSLRGGVRATDIIENLRALKDQCLARNILPIFLTLPPINPANIEKVFNESTVLDWQDQLQLVNDFIRTQEHIDVAREMVSSDGTLSTQMATDGLHPNIAGKKIMAAAINARWPAIKQLLK